MKKYCRALYPLWLYWLQDPVTFSCDFQLYYSTIQPTARPSDHELWVNAGYKWVFLHKGEGLLLSVEDHPEEDANAALYQQFPEVFELIEHENLA